VSQRRQHASTADQPDQPSIDDDRQPLDSAGDHQEDGFDDRRVGRDRDDRAGITSAAVRPVTATSMLSRCRSSLNHASSECNAAGLASRRSTSAPSAPG
jgi:hypothetical protein